MKKIAIMLAAVLICICVPQPLTASQLEADIEQFREFVFSMHPKFSYTELTELERNVEMGIAFNYALDNLIKQLPYINSDFQLRVELQRAVAILRDNHFFIPLDEAGKQLLLPLGMRWLSDGFYLIATDEGFEEALNTRLISINGYCIYDIFEDFKSFWSVENIYNARASFANELNNPAILKALGLFDADYYTVFTFENLDGDTVKISLNKHNKTATNIDNSLLAPRGQMIYVNPFDEGGFYIPDGVLWFDYMEDYSILYIRLEMYFREICWESFAFTFPGEVKAAFDELSPRAVVIDARDNPGGDYQPFIELFEFLAENVDEGRLFHIINENSLSAALVAAAHLKNLGAVVLGQPSGQNTDFYGFFGFTASSHFQEVFEMLLEFENISLDTIINANINYETIPMSIYDALKRLDCFNYVSLTPEITLHYSGIRISVPNMFVSAALADFYALRPHITINHTIYHWIDNTDPALEYILNKILAF